MRLTVVQCDCGNPEPHRKLRTEDGRKTEGFFSIAAGKIIHGEMLASGEVEQTGEEKAATEQELTSCGLPEEDSPMPKSPPLLSRPPLSEGLLEVLVVILEKFPPTDHQEMVGTIFRAGVITADEGERILTLAAQ